MPAVSLCCRVCATEHPLAATGTCTRCFGPLDPVYDWDALRARVSSRLDRGRPRFDLAVRRSAPRRGAGGGAPRSRPDAARSGVPARRGARDPRAVAEARHGEPDALLQGSRRRRRRPQGAGARIRHAFVLLDREPRGCSRRPCSRRGPRGGRLRPERPGAREARGCGCLRPSHLRRRRHVRPLLAPLGGAVVRAAVGVRQREPALVLRGGIEDARLRDRRAARLGDAGRGCDPDRVGGAVPQGRAGLRRARRARARRRHDAGADRRAGGRVRSGRDRVPRQHARRSRSPGQHRPLARDREPGRRRLRGCDCALQRWSDPHRRRGGDRLQHGSPGRDDGRLRRDGDRCHARCPEGRDRRRPGRAGRPGRASRHRRRVEDARPGRRTPTIRS